MRAVVKCAKPCEAQKPWTIVYGTRVGARSEALPAWHHLLELSPKAVSAVLGKRGFGLQVGVIKAKSLPSKC